MKNLLVIGKKKKPTHKKNLPDCHMVIIIIRTIAKPCEIFKISYFNVAPTVACSQT